MLIAHISDVHLGPLPAVHWRELANKRVFGYFNWQRNRARSFDLAVLTAITDDIRAKHPDHIAVTGDLVNLGLDAEYDAALAWLQTMGSPSDVTVVPGNHDAYLRRSVERYSTTWLPYANGDHPNPTMAFPFVRRRGSVAFIGLSTAVATGPFMATGVMDEAQAQAFGKALDETGREGLCRVVLIHHPPLHSLTTWPRRLIGASLVRREVARYGAELILHGHNHRTTIAKVPGPKGDVPLVGAAAPSILPDTRHPGGAYNLFDVAGSGGAYKIGMVERGFRGGAITTVSEAKF
ncbi:MAG TPA: metallophosphoesterase [Bauldia sp.]|nr:metallophosphoesterase [Bauldia sp.]